MTGAAIVSAARSGNAEAETSLKTYVDRLGRALAIVVSIIDPDVIVLAGGMSNVSELYPLLPAVVSRYVFGGEWAAPILPAVWGDSSGVRGAARLWPRHAADAATGSG